MEEIKQVIVVRKDLKMRKGKLAAQVAHASMKVFLDMMSKEKLENGMQKWSLLLNDEEDIYQWLCGLFTKIVVGVDSKADLLDLYVGAILAKIPCALVEDAGKTEFKRPTYTCIAIGPAKSEEIDKLTGHLILL